MTVSESRRARPNHSRRKPRSSARRPRARLRRNKRPGEKIVVDCTCGKKYRVGSHRAGTSFECRQCGRDVNVARYEVSVRTRQAILAEIGLKDLDQAKEVYEGERAESVRRRAEARGKRPTYHCIECGEKISDPSAAYRPEGIVCEDCQAATVVHRDQLADAGTGAAPAGPGRGKSSLKEWNQADAPTDATAETRGVLYTALFAAGFIGLSHTLLPGAGVLVNWLVPAAIAAAGGWFVYGNTAQR